MMGAIAGGATAKVRFLLTPIPLTKTDRLKKPFMTHHNDLDMTMYMRMLR